MYKQFLFKMSVGVGLGLVFVHLFSLVFCVFWFSLDYLWPPCVADVDIIYIFACFFLSSWFSSLILAVACKTGCLRIG